MGVVDLSVVEVVAGSIGEVAVVGSTGEVAEGSTGMVVAGGIVAAAAAVAWGRETKGMTPLACKI